MAGDRQHYIPAALIGGFGRPAVDRRLRHATVAVRKQSTGLVVPVFPTADSVGVGKGVYRLHGDAPGIDRNVIDKLWGAVEPHIPGLVERLTYERLEPGDSEALLAYAAMAAVRHPKFALIAAEWQRRHDLPEPVGDDIHLMRVHALENQLREVKKYRWRVLHSPPGNRRFMVSDRGWMLVGGDLPAVLLPMGPRVAILGYPDDPALPPRRPPFEEHFGVVDSWIEWFNAATWADHEYTDLLIAHPDDLEQLEHIRDHDQVIVNGHGPFVGRYSAGLYD